MQLRCFLKPDWILLNSLLSSIHHHSRVERPRLLRRVTYIDLREQRLPNGLVLGSFTYIDSQRGATVLLDTVKPKSVDRKIMNLAANGRKVPEMAIVEVDYDKWRLYTIQW